MLEQKFEELQKVHARTEEMIAATENVSGSLMTEYRRGVDQYKGMYQSIEMFKKDCSAGATKSFITQQTTILENWIEYELNIQEKLNK